MAPDTHSQWTYPGCDDVTDADFTVTPVVTRELNDPTMWEPVKMALHMRANGIVDVYYIQRREGDGSEQGVVKRYDGQSKAVSTLGSITVQWDWEDGLTGIALDPNFASNNRMYLFYGHTSGFRISRFTLSAEDKKLDLASEKVMITIPATSRRWHTSGAMQFDAYGDLWISVGDNKTSCDGPGNTADLRGKILRIHPEEDGGYNIPEGNMWEFAAAYFRGKGQGAVAEKYLDSSLMKREIFAMGTRNSYTLTLDPVRRWAVYGDCGPDEEGKSDDRAKWTEEHNVVTEPGFMGWPYWSADQHVSKKIPYGSGCKDDYKSMDPGTPINDGGAIAELMPAVPATYPYSHSCAMTGPIFLYDGRLPRTDQIPPHFNRIWFTSDFNHGWIRAVRLDDQGHMVGEAVEMFDGLSDKFKKPLDFQQGPDGALYYLNYTCGTWRTADECTGIYRISYTGTCRDPDLIPEGTVAADRAIRGAPSIRGFEIRGNSVFVSQEGAHILEVFSPEGRQVFRDVGYGSVGYPAGHVFGSRPGLFQVRLITSEGTATWMHPYLDTNGR